MDKSKNIAIAYSLAKRNKRKMARGGELERKDFELNKEPRHLEMDDSDDIVDETMNRYKMMSEGGMMDERDKALELNNVVPPNKMHNEFNYDAAEYYVGGEDAMEDADSPYDSNLKGNEEHDDIMEETAKRMRAKMRK